MRLIYLDNYEILDKNMSDSQVGARKGKYVRNHIWLLNGVICDMYTNPVFLAVMSSSRSDIVT